MHRSKDRALGDEQWQKRATPAGGVARWATRFLPCRAPFQTDNLISDNAARPFGPYGLPSDSHISK